MFFKKKYIKLIAAIITLVVYLNRFGVLGDVVEFVKNSDLVSKTTNTIEETTSTITSYDFPELPDTPHILTYKDDIPGEKLVNIDKAIEELSGTSLDLSNILTEASEYDGKPSIKINGNKPFFTENELSLNYGTENYSELDNLGRCGAAIAMVGPETLPTKERGKIGSIKPTGWVQNKYPGLVDSNPGYLYNRCHLIAYCLTAENANEKNLITGTRYLNVEGMLPFEIEVANYVESTGNHVLYRSTPIFEGDNLLASGVLLEAQSIEDKNLVLCVYCYNVQPGIYLDYATGENYKAES